MSHIVESLHWDFAILDSFKELFSVLKAQLWAYGLEVDLQ